MANQVPSLPGILGQSLFDQYAANWLAIISRPDTAALQQSFVVADDQPLLAGVGFPLERIAQLVGTVGAVNIKARFVIMPPVAGSKPLFSVALFATDSLDARLSSYYVPDQFFTDPLLVAQGGGPTVVHRNQIANSLGQRWARNWQGIKDVKPEFFASHYGPLRGYTFELGEFMAPFFRLDDLAAASLRLSFVLHDYYQPSPTGDDVLTYTFALVLRLERGDKLLDGDDPLMDTAKPCPPTC
ncbi:hypothetical protein E4631_08550 [Hymenobacter sp. UV11]|uniref:hypothetical protein n=1 Tax=Hymenobacter sp. UV11 TaxID=1849735 RepID=UPI001061A078|nr:hypothetical protein [Hymenobacter sp. UV11]TDN36287.1 hypothetical protein A8B98_10255 [Hymenobacter sp. UV11]TFZ66995.1 hypothetical protein E4631_08550 [Hymenobacter sp. UV11]